MERPFFYRISEPKPRVSTGDLATIKMTVAEEIGRILATRCAGGIWGERNILNFGLPHPAEAFNEKPDLNALALLVRDSIAAYEPRLSNIQVHVMPSGNPEQAQFKVAADMLYDGDVEKFTLVV